MRKVVASVVSACIAFSSLTFPSLASEGNNVLSSSLEENSEVEALKNVVLKAKEKITVPDELEDFSYTTNYANNQYSKDQYWNLTWRDKERNKKLNVKITNDGNILSYSNRDYSTDRIKPVYLKDELEGEATDFIKKVAPEIANNIKLKGAEFLGTYNGTYLYTFERVENGVKMPDNFVQVSVDYEKGEVKSFESNWTFDVEIPNYEVNLTIDDARNKIGENVKMELKYMKKIEERDGNKIVKAYLVYEPDKSYIAIDAKTGEIYETHNEFYEMGEYNKENLTEDVAAAEQSSGSVGLTEKEVAKIEEMKDLITKEQAISSVTAKKDVLLLDDNAKAVTARLSPKYGYNAKDSTEYVWYLNFNDPRDVSYDSKDIYIAYSRATVDAKTGKLLSFYSSVKDYYDPESKEWESVKVKYTEEEGRNVFEEFVKSMEMEKFENTKLTDSNATSYVLKYVNDAPVYGGYSYNYSRFNEGIKYSYNNISGKVDGVTGKIYSYDIAWTDNIEFESPKNVMSEKEAYEAYSHKEGFNLVYEINNKHYIENDPAKKDYYDYSELYILEKEARLVYRIDIYPQYISPFTGVQLDYSGKAYEKNIEKTYSDISGFWGERNIRLITDMGYTFDSNSFLPNEIITKDEFFKLLNTIGVYASETEYADLEKVTKLDAIKILIEKKGLGDIAKLSDIYAVPFEDMNLVDKSDVGYIALAKGLKVIVGDAANNCKPNKELSRIEAVCMILNFANIR